MLAVARHCTHPDGVRELPWWAAPVIEGLMVGASGSLPLWWGSDVSTLAPLASAFTVGLFWAALSAHDLRRRRAAAAVDVGHLGGDTLRRVELVLDGEDPADEEERETALRVARFRVAHGRRLAGPVGTIAIVVMLALTFLALRSSPWWWAVVVPLAAGTFAVGRPRGALRRGASELQALVAG